MVIVIPAFEPSEQLIHMIEQLISDTNYPIIIINDGSSIEKNSIFNRLKAYVDVLNHETNQGKGEAMKTGLKYIQKNLPFEDGVVFMDADGQHKISDMEKVIENFYLDPGALILGCREFKGEIPLKSLLGNKITRVIFRLLSGVRLSDTQTGLRAISTRYIPMLLEIEGERYEYEMNILFTFAGKKIRMIEVPIETIYDDKVNSTSHFRVIKDSIRVYGVILKFMTSSAMSAGVDYILFLLFLHAFSNIAFSGTVVMSNILARVISAVMNYHLNKQYVFQNKEKSTGYAIQYTVLAIGILIANSIVLYTLSTVFGLPPALAKIFTETMLFIISFLVQQRFIFRKKMKNT